MRGNRGKQGMDDGAMEFTMDELREFLEGDIRGVLADPAFKERLRLKLWEMVRLRGGPRDDETGQG
jgi:hypothetical protein